MKSGKAYRVVFGTILFINLPPACYLIRVFGNEFTYVTRQGKWSFEDQFSGQRYEDVYAFYWRDKEEPGYEHDEPLYRTASINPLKFWRWYDYATHPRWQLPYNNQPDTLTKGPVDPNPEKIKLWNRMQQLNETL